MGIQVFNKTDFHEPEVGERCSFCNEQDRPMCAAKLCVHWQDDPYSTGVAVDICDVCWEKFMTEE